LLLLLLLGVQILLQQRLGQGPIKFHHGVPHLKLCRGRGVLRSVEECWGVLRSVEESMGEKHIKVSV
jgi:hypothetical protein